MDDVEYIAAKMRTEDVEEIYTLLGVSGKEALKNSFKDSTEAWISDVDGNIVCIYGMVFPSTLWMIFIRDLDSLPKSFFSASKVVVDKLLRKYGRLENYTASTNTFILKWLTWLGFSIGPVELINDYPIRKFTKKYRKAV